MKEVLAKVIITVEETETNIDTHVTGYVHKKLNKWDRADMARHLCRSMDITPDDVALWDLASKINEEEDDK